MIDNSILYGAAGFAALALLVYLVVALLRAEDL
ncbi:potassium-transporting ATPase subunit F [Xylophilus sp. GW821-FHT01B05]